jgi:quinolinate synthase
MLRDDTEKLREQIRKLKRDRRAVILAHNYQLGEVQDIADHTGDSLELSRKAAATDAAVIVFCGVHFMAETAKILAPRKTVLLPELEAGCPMADMIDAPSLEKLRDQHPGAAVVTYVNSSAAVKALSDVCCTSANAAKVVATIPAGQEILFVPDQYLGSYVMEQSGRPMTLWPGFCPTHARILPEHVVKQRALYPGAPVAVHPECRPAVTRLADQVLSTSGILRFGRETPAQTVLVGTELGILHRLQQDSPQKRFVPITEQAICPNMKRTTLESVAWALSDLRHVIEIPEEVRAKAEQAVQKMIAIG